MLVPLCLLSSLIISAPEHQITVAFPCIRMMETETSKIIAFQENTEYQRMKLLGRKQITERLSNTMDTIYGPKPCKMLGPFGLGEAVMSVHGGRKTEN
jgi:hypothetical protein